MVDVTIMMTDYQGSAVHTISKCPAQGASPTGAQQSPAGERKIRPHPNAPAGGPARPRGTGAAAS